MISKPFEHQPTIYRPEDIKFRDGNPYLSIILGQMVLELALKNVGSHESPIWIAWFDPREAEVQKAGTQALITILDDMGNVGLAITPFSSKSGLMIAEACQEVDLPLLTLNGSKDLAALEQQAGDGAKIYSYNPVTSLETPKYMAFSEEAIFRIKNTISHGGQIAVIDDVYSTGATVKAALAGLKEILGKDYDDTLIEIVTVAREGVIHNGDDLPALDLDQPLTFEVFIPEVIGDLNAAINAQPTTKTD